jgi:cupin 2 domain-containing protein
VWRRGKLSLEIPSPLRDEHCSTLTQGAGVRIERIVSRGHASAEGFWYDQDENEYVLVVSGGARLEIEGHGSIELQAGDWIDLPAHVRHRVAWTDPTVDTIWLAVFYDAVRADAEQAGPRPTE